MKDNEGIQLYCSTGKAVYSQKEAFAALNKYRKFKHGNSKSKKPTRAYKCEICHEWHLTSGKKISAMTLFLNR